MTTRKKRGESILIKVSQEHLLYEYSMLIETSKITTTNQPGCLQNVLLESFLTHFRALYDFFYIEKRRLIDDDVIADDFFLDNSVWENKPAASCLLRESRCRTNKELTHLTYSRLDVPADKKGWSFKPIAEEIHKLMNKFLEAAPKNAIAQELRQYHASITDSAL